MDNPVVTVIIPTLDAERLLPRLLAALEGQSLAVSELLVVDSSSTDGTVEVAKSAGARILTVRREEFDHGGTRSLAGRQARGGILVYLTQDAVPCDAYSLERLVAPLVAHDDVGAAYGRQHPAPGASPFGRHLRLFNYPAESRILGIADKATYRIKTAFLSNSFAAYRRKALDDIGWFRERLILGEDMYAGAKMLMKGYRLAYAADAGVVHSHSYTALQELRRYFDIGVFHRSERWILDEFGNAEGEGARYVQSELRELAKEGKLHLLPHFLVRNGMKYLGYRLGRHYEALPPALRRSLSMHPGWWGD